MNTKYYLAISGIVGGIIGSLLTALLVPPVTAQRDKFGHIECTKLTVVDGEGTARVVMSGGAWDSSTPFGSEDLKHAGVFIGRAGLYSGVVDVYGDWSHPMGVLQEIANESPEIVNEGEEPEQFQLPEGLEGLPAFIVPGGENTRNVDQDPMEPLMGYDGKVRIGVDTHGGFVSAWNFDNDGKPAAKAELTALEHGGNVSVWFAERLEVAGELGVDERGGYLSVSENRKDKEKPWLRSKARMGIDEYGGYLQVWDEKRGLGGKAAIGINDYGNGAVSTWDKNGNRQE